MHLLFCFQIEQDKAAEQTINTAQTASGKQEGWDLSCRGFSLQIVNLVIITKFG